MKNAGRPSEVDVSKKLRDRQQPLLAQQRPKLIQHYEKGQQVNQRQAALERKSRQPVLRTKKAFAKAHPRPSTFWGSSTSIARALRGPRGIIQRGICRAVRRKDAGRWLRA